MKKYKYILLFIALPFFPAGANKGNFLLSLQELLQQYHVLNPQEKVYVQTDKTYYKPEETIWYKSFLVNAGDNKPSLTSDVLYVELRDPQGNVVFSQKYITKNGSAEDSFTLDEDAPGGIYKLIAYTQWMKNQGQECFFTKEITVQKLITPRLLLKVDFEKRGYGPGDEVVANLKVTDLKNVNTTGSVVKSTVRLKGKPVQTLENKSENGEVKIKFTLPDDLDTADGILQMVVTDKGIRESITRSIPVQLNKISLEFYPEGGDMMENTPNKVAFEALNEFGKGTGISGYISDENGNQITPFESFHLGMGAFVFTPEKGRKYYASITQPAGNKEPVELPEIYDNGYILHLESKDEYKLQWNIYATEEGNISLIGQTQGTIYYSKEIFLKKGFNRIDVPTNDFPVGIAIFTLFDRQNREACERRVFINPDKGLKISVESKEVYYPGEEANLTIKTTDREGNPVSANLGLAVVDEQLLTLADDKQDNILSYLLFSSELKGTIEEPYFYFDESEKKAREAIDYLMLTHGWTRFSWKEVMNPMYWKRDYFPEKVSSIYGYVLNKEGNATQAEVFLIETNTGKIGKVKTTPEGHFVFHGVNPSDHLLITTKLPDQVFLFKGKPAVLRHNPVSSFSPDDDNEIDLPEETEKRIPDLADINNRQIMTDEYVAYDESNFELSEVVVVGYGVEQRRDITSSVAVIRESAIIERDVNSALSGKVAGMVSAQSTIAPGTSQDIKIRGISSSMSSGNPLVMINGIPVESESGDIRFVNPQDIASIRVVKNSTASAVYGSRAANGAIIIETKKHGLKQKYKDDKPQFGGIFIKSRENYSARQFNTYEHNRENNNSTVYWKGKVVTNQQGIAKVFFPMNNQSSAYRITVEGIGPETGLIGSKTKRIVTKKQFSIDAKCPLFAGVGDIVKLPVIVTNNSSHSVPAKLNVKLPGNSMVVYKDTLSKTVHIPANESVTVYFSLKAKNETENYPVEISGNTGSFSDRINRSITIRQINFPYVYSISGRDTGQVRNFELPEHIPGTLKAEAISYTNILDELSDGVESIFREPYGCFEQLSSSTFPNIFALQLLKATNQDMPHIAGTALQYLESGYKKLAAYEVEGGGFEWYGGSPAHEVLSAYGLVEFYEMSKVYDKVNKSIMDHTRNFILSRKDGKGGFKQNNGQYGFSGAPENVNNAYIVFALTETGYIQDIQKEYQTALQEALTKKDLYRMALMANTAYNMNDMDSYRKLTQYFKEYAASNDFSKIKVQATIVYTYGEAAIRETIAFWMIALLKNKENPDLNLIENCMVYINKGRVNGSFGTTQTTSICLQALTKYAEFQSTDKIEGSLCLSVNTESFYNPMTKGIKSKIDFTDKLVKGNNRLQISYTETEEVYPYNILISWQTNTPPTSKECPLRLSARLAHPTIKVNETVRLSVTLTNSEKQGKPMSVAVIGIPGGMSLQPWQLKELQDKEVYDFYEIINDNLVIYYRELGPKEVKTIDLDLKAEIPGKYKGMASSAYIYYTNEHKYWLEGLSVEVTE